MEDDDHDELLQCTDDESLSETDDQCLPIEKPEEQIVSPYSSHSKAQLLVSKILLIFHTTGLLILFPPYLESVANVGNAYSILITNTCLCTCAMLLVNIVLKLFHDEYPNIKTHRLPIKFPKLAILTLTYFLCGILITYALDRKRVLCHLQDPIKGIVLVFSLLYYFFFCRKFMGLQRIFSATTIIVGLFIAVDYGLCDEFKCRGAERKHLSKWNWRTHTIWTGVYILGLAIFSAFYTLLERYLLTEIERDVNTINIPSTFLSTVSQSVSYPNANKSVNKSPQNSHFLKKYSPYHLVLWMHVFGFVILLVMFWMDLLPYMGKTSNLAEFYNNTITGIMCHFTFEKAAEKCNDMVYYSWLFLYFYSMFIITSVKFLLLTQSAVYTIATMSSSLPLIGIWWSLFQLNSNGKSNILWSPAVSGELICSLLGFPVVLIGLILLCKAHFKDYQWSRIPNVGGISNNQYA